MTSHIREQSDNNMASVASLEKKVKERKITRSTVKSRDNAQKLRETNKENHEGVTSDHQKLHQIIQLRDTTIKQLQKELDDARKVNETLTSENRRIRGELSEETREETRGEEPKNQHVVGRRRQRKEGSKSERLDSPPKSPKEETRKTDHKNLIKVAIEESLNERQYQLHERKRRASNIILHGIKENTENDTDSIKKFFEAVQVNLTPKSFTRLGNEKHGLNRPVRITMKNVKDKQSVLKGLPKLKDAKLDVSVTDDHTKEDRRTIATLVSEAKRRTLVERGPHVWRVKGSPATRLRLVRIEQKNVNRNATKQADKPTNTIEHFIEA